MPMMHTVYLLHVFLVCFKFFFFIILVMNTSERDCSHFENADMDRKTVKYIFVEVTLNVCVL